MPRIARCVVAVGVKPSIRITAVPAGKTCTVQGFDPLQVPNYLRLVVEDCPGRVHLDGLVITYACAFVCGGGMIDIERCAQVTLSDCTISHSAWLRVGSSTVAVSRSTLIGTNGDLAGGFGPAPGADLDHATISFAECTVGGGDAGGGFASNSSPSIVTQNSTITIAGDASSTIFAGYTRKPQPAIATNGDTLWIDSNVVLKPNASAGDRRHLHVAAGAAGLAGGIAGPARRLAVPRHDHQRRRAGLPPFRLSTPAIVVVQ